VGGVCLNPADIRVSFRQARAALRYRCRYGYNSVIDFNNVEGENRVTYRYPHCDERALVYAAVRGERDYAVSLSAKLFDALAGADGVSQNLVSHMIMSVIMQINRYADEKGLELDVLDGFFNMDEIFSVNSVAEGRVYFINRLEKLAEHTAALQTGIEENLLARALTYIDGHSVKEITPATVSSALGQPMEYINELFKRFRGETLPGYIRILRVNEAKRLIRASNMDDMMVAINVGYTDVAHFRSVFRQLTGQSTTEYRSAVIGG
jgi:YesN/AraC family two-component response regulator